VEVLLRRALDRGECGDHAVSDEVVEFLASRTGGDARAALAALEVACDTANGEITMEVAEDALRRRAVRYDKAGDQHYDYISALIKSMRGSDPDAAVYYLTVMLEGGEDPRYLARRMIVLASEDVGNADPHALPLAVATAAAVEHVGAPECSYALAQCAIYLALAPKSNSALRALGAARRHVRDHGAQLPPDALRSAAYPGAAALGRGQGYDYPHDRPERVSPQELLPDAVADERFVELDATEPELRDRLQRIRDARHR
jgi:putative ATPase